MKKLCTINPINIKYLPFIINVTTIIILTPEIVCDFGLEIIVGLMGIANKSNTAEIQKTVSLVYVSLVRARSQKCRIRSLTNNILVTFQQTDVCI